MDSDICLEEGACYNPATDIGDGFANDYNECRDLCATTTNCNFFTYFSDRNECLLFSDCGSVNSGSCSNCVSGSPTCPDLLCDVPGWCDGNFLSAPSGITSSDECLRACKDYPGPQKCAWYIFDTNLNFCTLNSDCTFYDPSIPNSVTGQRECPLGSTVPPTPGGKPVCFLDAYTY